jgi:Domain of unknown function DUF11
MKWSRLLGFALPIALLAGVVACGDSTDVTGANGALGRLEVRGPDSATSGIAFNVDVTATNVGVQGIHNGIVQVTLPAPLNVNSVEPSPGTQATFSNGGGGSTVSWTLNTLDSNTQSTLRINTTGVLLPGQPAQTLRVQASMTADGINAGDAVGFKDIQLMP